MMRKYLATLDDGHDYSSVEFFSDSRKGSKANLQDCKDTIRRKYGVSRAKQLVIKSIERYEVY